MDIHTITDKLETLQMAKDTLNNDIRQAHGVEGDDEEVLLNWDEQRDIEYLYDRIDLFAALHSLVSDDNIDSATKKEMLRVLTADAHDVIAERKADIDKANAVIDDMQQLLSLCEQAEDTLS